MYRHIGRAPHGKTSANTPKQSITPSSSGKDTKDNYTLEHDELGNGSQAWQRPQRPAGSSPCQDNSFCLEDDSIVNSIESMLQCMIIGDPHQKGHPIVYASHGMESFLGYSREELLGSCFTTAIQGKHGDKDVALQLKQGIKDKQFMGINITGSRKDGKAFPCFMCVVPVMDAHDNLLRVMAVPVDLDDKRRKEQQADEHFETKWQEQIHYYLQSFMLLDTSKEGCPITAVSPGFTTLTGYTQSDVSGCSCLCLSGQDSSSEVMARWMHAAKGSEGRTVTIRLLCYKRDGTPMWCHIMCCPLTPPRGCSTRQALCVVADITTSRLKRVGRYILGKVIGSGAYGIVRLGKVPGSDEVVAIKSVDASKFRSISEIEQIQEEMSVLSSLKHPHIIRLVEIHFVSSVFFLVMEFASGGSLVKYIRSHEGHRLPETEAHRLFMQILSAVDYCHRRRVIHRDLKPENILMDDQNNIKVADFGLAAVTAPFSQRGLTQQCGTPEFSAPEISVGKEYDGPDVDIWSLGVILYEALAGVLPFTGKNLQELNKSIQRGAYPPLPGHISQECRDVIRGMLQVDAQKRLTMPDILDHPWCRGEVGHDDTDGSPQADGYEQQSSQCQAQQEDPTESQHHYDDHNYDLPALNTTDSQVEMNNTMVSPSDAATLHSRATARRVFSSEWDGLGDKPSSPSAMFKRAASAVSIHSARSARESGDGSTALRPSSRQGINKSSHTHDSVSVRLVIDNANDVDDPITAAIMRAQMAAMGALSVSGPLESPPRLGSLASQGGSHMSRHGTVASFQGRSSTAGNSVSDDNNEGPSAGVGSISGPASQRHRAGGYGGAAGGLTKDLAPNRRGGSVDAGDGRGGAGPGGSMSPAAGKTTRPRAGPAGNHSSSPYQSSNLGNATTCSQYHGGNPASGGGAAQLGNPSGPLPPLQVGLSSAGSSVSGACSTGAASGSIPATPERGRRTNMLGNAMGGVGSGSSAGPVSSTGLGKKPSPGAASASAGMLTPHPQLSVKIGSGKGSAYDPSPMSSRRNLPPITRGAAGGRAGRS